MAADHRTPSAVNALKQRLETLESETRTSLEVQRVSTTTRSSVSLAIYRGPSPSTVHFHGMSDGIDPAWPAERQTEQPVEWLGDDRVGIIRRLSRPFGDYRFVDSTR